MAGTFRLSSAIGGNLSPYQAAILPGLPASARLLITILDRRSKGHPECWCGNATLAGLLKCCERSIRNALTALEGAGLIRVVRDYTLKSRRRIVLLWRRSVDAFVPANVVDQVAANTCPEVGPPPDPPIVEPEGKTEIEGGGGCEAEADPAPPPPEIFPAPVQDGEEEKARKQAYLDATVADAEKLFGPGRRGWVIASAKELGRGLLALRAAIRRGLEKVAEGGKVSTGYVIRTADGMRAAGGPPPELANPERAKAEADAKCIAEMQRLEALWT